MVLTTLTFFSILLAAYLVSSNQARESSFAIAARNINRPDNNAILNQGMMMLLRGTADPNSPFFGEDLLSDYYGRRDYLSLIIEPGSTPSLTNQFARITCISDPDDPNDMPLNGLIVNDQYAGRVITFTSAQDPSWENTTFRVLRSIRTATNNVDLIFAVPTELDAAQLTDNDKLTMNGVPRNAAGVGFASGSISIDTMPQTFGGSPRGFSMPLVFQPNHLNRAVDKRAALGAERSSDFDEGYDASDFNNWFLCHRRPDGSVIPSFHRPSVLNYIINEQPSWSSASPDLVVSLARGTFRPLPIHSNFAGTNLNEAFTGGNENFALRAPLPLNNEAQLNQFMLALVNGQLDVDNDASGVNDSVWIDLDLPLITSPEGKLLKPMIAPMIEDLSGRLNINAHHNVVLTPSSTTTLDSAGLQSDQALWAGTRSDIPNPSIALPAASPNRRTVFRGLGTGPAEIALPTVPLSNMVNSRYLRRPGDTASPQQPGTDGADVLDTLRTGARPARQTTSNGHGYSIDPFGRGGTGIGRSGEIVAAESGRVISVDDSMTAFNETINESVNDPYEYDPSGASRGDLALTLDEFEVFLRSNDFDLAMLPGRLRNLLATSPGLANAVTPLSVSDDTLPPVSFAGGESTFEAIARALTDMGVPAASLEEVIAPEIRRGNKIDINRRTGNLVDDTVPPNGVIDEPGEVVAETVAFAPSSDVPTNYNSTNPSYSFGATDSGRALLARHLYVLMMAVTDGVDFPVTDSSVVNATNYKARRVAQWAVNVVDYRDPDSIMTRFQFDPSPLTGAWTPSEEVWGVEAPDLLFSEATAFHDVGVRDTDLDSSGRDKSAPMMPDEDTDQVRIPQGSLFLELLCPRATVDNTDENQASNFGFPQELYSNVSAGPPTLDLARLAPGGSPVWRVAFSDPHYDALPGRYAASGNEDNDPEAVRTDRVESASFDPASLDEVDSAFGSLGINRFLLFRTFADPGSLDTLAPTLGVAPEQVFFLRSSTASLEPGQFVTIAPRSVTSLGSHAPSPGAVADRPSSHRFSVEADGVIHFRQDNTRHTPMLERATTASYTPALPLIAETFPPSTILGAPANFSANVFADNRVGLNVSEPLPSGGNYYPEPTFRYLGTTSPEFPLSDAYVEISSGGMTAPNVPFDVDSTFGDRLPVSEVPTAPTDGVTSNETALGTIPRYCSAFLQRLANPLLPFDATTNPYRTVDWMSIDLNVFSGEEQLSAIVQGGEYTQRTRQRNGFIDGNRVNALYSYSTDFEDPSATLDEMASDYFSFSETDPVAGAMQSSLNFLNTEDSSNTGFVGFHPSIGSGGAAGVANDHWTDRNFPQIPYAVHPWLNRDFATHYELMMVPACSQSRLFEEFSVSTSSAITSVASDAAGTLVTTLTPHGFEDGDWIRVDGVEGLTSFNGDHQIITSGLNNFTIAFALPATPIATPGTGVVSKIPDVYAGMANRGQLNSWTAPFRHLLNFFHNPANAADTVPLGRFLDLVHTTPRFSGELEAISPANVTADLNRLYPVPFNFVFDNRRQGMINPNTLNNFQVWRGLMQGHLNDAEYTNPAGMGAATQLAFDTFLQNRRGYLLNETFTPVTGTGPFNYLPNHLRSELPTEFAGVFRDASRAAFMPAVRDAGATALLRRSPNNSGLLRNHSTLDNPTPAAGETANASKFVVRDIRQTPVAPVWTQFLAPASVSSPALPMDRNRNPWMRYQTAMRMPNLASDNSQVFVVRLTLGFFEVDPSNTNNLGVEYNESIGEVQRYKALFVIDRSRPVGFIPGQDLNARDTVIFERFFQ